MTYAPSEDSDQPGHLPRLICLAGRLGHFLGFVMRQFMYFSVCTLVLQQAQKKMVSMEVLPNFSLQCNNTCKEV